LWAARDTVFGMYRTCSLKNVFPIDGSEPLLLETPSSRVGSIHVHYKAYPRQGARKRERERERESAARFTKATLTACLMNPQTLNPQQNIITILFLSGIQLLLVAEMHRQGQSQPASCGWRSRRGCSRSGTAESARDAADPHGENRELVLVDDGLLGRHLGQIRQGLQQKCVY
jgi:hypothetical protein